MMKKTQETKTFSKLRRTFAAVVALFAVCLVLIAPAVAADGILIESTTPDKVGDGWTYDASENMLTLNNANSITYINATGVDLNIKLIGENNINGGFYSPEFNAVLGISVAKNLTIQGLGSLNVNVVDASVCGIYVHDGNITITDRASVTVDVVATTVSDGALADASGIVAYMGGNITITDRASVTVDVVATTSGADSPAVAVGIVALDCLLISDHALVAVEGVAAITSGADSDVIAEGIYAGKSISISDASVYVEGVSATAYGVNSEVVHAISIYALDDLLSISDSEVTVTTKSVNFVYGVFAIGGFSVIDSTVTVIADGDSSVGIYTGDCGFSVTDSTVAVIADGDSAAGIYTEGCSFSVTDSMVTATATGDMAYGIYAENEYATGGTISITGGTILARSTGQAVYGSDGLTVDLSSLVIKASRDICGANLQVTEANEVVSSTTPYKYVFIGPETTEFYTVSYDSNGGEPAYEPIKYPAGVSILVASPVSKEGYDFVGWFDGELEGTPGLPLVVNRNIAFVAQWEDIDGPSTPPDTPSTGGGSAVDTGSGKFSEYPRTVTDDGSVSFGTSPVVAEVSLPKGSTGSVVLKVASVDDWPGTEKTPYAFDITAPGKAEGIAQIIFKIKLAELERLEVLPKDVGIFHKVGEEWVQLKTVYEIKDEYVYYTAETDSFSPFELRFVENGAVAKDGGEPFVPETPVVPDVPDVPNEPVLPEIPDTPVEPETPKTSAPILGVLAGLGAALALRRK